MSNKKLTIISVSLLSLYLIATFATFRQEAQEKPGQEKPTVVQRGQITDEQRVYSKEYDKMYPDRRKIKLGEVRKEIKDLGIGLRVVGDIIEIPEAPVITLSELLKSLTCKSDAVVVGYPTTKTARLSEDETFIYTEYQFSVEEVIKNNSSSLIAVKNDIQITRPGGVIKLDNRKITAIDELYEPLQVKKKYLLFLKSVPGTQGYMPADSEGDLLLEDKSFRKLSKDRAPDELRKGDNSNSILGNVRSSAVTDCKQTTKGGN